MNKHTLTQCRIVNVGRVAVRRTSNMYVNTHKISNGRIQSRLRTIECFFLSLTILKSKLLQILEIYIFFSWKYFVQLKFSCSFQFKHIYNVALLWVKFINGFYNSTQYWQFVWRVTAQSTELNESQVNETNLFTHTRARNWINCKIG